MTVSSLMPSPLGVKTEGLARTLDRASLAEVVGTTAQEKGSPVLSSIPTLSDTLTGLSDPGLKRNTRNSWLFAWERARKGISNWSMSRSGSEKVRSSASCVEFQSARIS